jgi:hypothetical protein
VIADDGEYCEEQEIEDWEFSQEITSEEPIAEDSSYGFANMRSDILQRLREESRELFEYLEISTVKNAERTEMRVHSEQAKFDEDHYLSRFRRALIFPFHRSFALGEKCQKDAAKILKHG